MLTRTDIMSLRSLRDKKERLEQGIFVVEGHKMVREAVASGWGVTMVYTTGPVADYGQVPVTSVSPAQFERISGLKSPQGVLATVRIPKATNPRVRSGKLTVALDGVQDPGNLGTIIRVADWFGVEDILCSADTADCFNPKTVQASMGSVFRVRMHYGSLAGWLDQASRDSIPVYGAFLDGENIYTGEFSPSGIVVMGNEGNGISEPVEKYICRRICIPSFPAVGEGAESLNVAVATAVIVSELRRRSL